MPRQAGQSTARSTVGVWCDGRTPAAYSQALRGWGATVEVPGEGRATDRRVFFNDHAPGQLVVSGSGPLPTLGQTAGTGSLWLLQPSAAWLEPPACPVRLLASTASLAHGLRLMDIRAQATGRVSISIDFSGPQDAGDFTVALADALDLVRRIAGPIESVAASISGGGVSGTMSAEPLPALSALGVGGGDLVARIGCEDGSVGALRVSVGGEWKRHVSINGAFGQIELHLGELSWRGPGGALVEQTEMTGPTLESAIAASLEPSAPLVNCAVLAIDCEAACLSAITGDVERPARMCAALGVSDAVQAAMISPIFTRR